jgi:hypothetical protein
MGFRSKKRSVVGERTVHGFHGLLESAAAAKGRAAESSSSSAEKTASMVTAVESNERRERVLRK